MERHVMWVPADKPGLEHLHLKESPEGIRFNSIVIGIDQDPYRVRYEIICDAQWRVHRLSIVNLETADSLQLQSDGQGNWSTPAGEALPELFGCTDVDIDITPFTNAIPIRRLKLQPGQSVEVKVIYVRIPSMDYATTTQRYTCIETTNRGGLYEYSSPGIEDPVRLPVDGDGLVINYPEAYRRVLPE